jgi:hypothetical protein
MLRRIYSNDKNVFNDMITEFKFVLDKMGISYSESSVDQDFLRFTFRIRRTEMKKTEGFKHDVTFYYPYIASALDIALRRRVTTLLYGLATATGEENAVRDFYLMDKLMLVYVYTVGDNEVAVEF